MLNNYNALSIHRDSGVCTLRRSSPPELRRDDNMDRNERASRRRRSRTRSPRRSPDRARGRGSRSREKRRYRSPSYDDRRYRGNQRHRREKYDRYDDRYERTTRDPVYNRRQPWDRYRSPSPDDHYRRSRSGETDHSYYSDESESTERIHKTRNSRKVKSGINAKPSSSVHRELTYPHFSLGQISGYVAVNISFHQLTYEQFVAGEMHTILRTREEVEKYGRERLLSKIATWKLRVNVTWAQVRNAYAIILRQIENGEATWDIDFNTREYLIYEKVMLKTEKEKIERDRIRKTTGTGDWFCKAFQREDGCSKETPHWGTVLGKPRMVQHFCATCWQKDRTKRMHSESSMECQFKTQ